MYQIQPCGYVPPGGGDGGGGGGGGDDEEPPAGSFAFSGSVYVDPDAFTAGLSGTDSLCTGDTGTSIASGGSVTAKRPEQGSPVGVTLSGASYSVGVSNGADTYTLALNLPFPPADPDNPLQCACNSDPSNPYRCVYTNQEPNTGPKNFFVKYGGEPTTAWFQTLGGSSFAFGSIESKIPFDTCSAPLCIPALIARDPAGTLDSPGFALTGTGAVVTSDTGGVYIHEADGRSNALQAEALGVRVPTENYDYFFSKFGAKAVTLPNAGKPIVDNELNVFAYNGDLTLDNTNPWNLSSSEKIIVFVNGDLTIDDTPSGENRITSVAEGGDAFLMFITRGDILVTSDVGYDDITTDPTDANVANVEGVFVADGTLTIAGGGVAIGGSAPAETVVTSFTTIGTATWTAPDDVTQVEAFVVAGGGGGGGGQYHGGGGGGGGVISDSSFTVTPGNDYTVTVGGGGTGGTNARGTNGSNSIFGSLTAIGGGGGGRQSV